MGVQGAIRRSGFTAKLTRVPKTQHVPGLVRQHAIERATVVPSPRQNPRMLLSVEVNVRLDDPPLVVLRSLVA
jgi:hypothetical protein